MYKNLRFKNCFHLFTIEQENRPYLFYIITQKVVFVVIKVCVICRIKREKTVNSSKSSEIILGKVETSLLKSDYERKNTA